MWHRLCLRSFSNPETFKITMKKNLKKAARTNYSLGDLILAVSSSAKNNRETIAAVADLLESGQVRLNSHGRKVRARVG